MAEIKTKKTGVSAREFIDAQPDDRLREDCRRIAAMMQEATRATPAMWGPSIVGFGRRLVKYADGSEREWMQIAFSPRKKNITLYLASDFAGRADLLDKLGPHAAKGGCLYLKSLDDVHLPTLKKLIKAAIRTSRST